MQIITSEFDEANTAMHLLPRPKYKTISSPQSLIFKGTQSHVIVIG